MKSNKYIILHIGFMKTGTTFLQKNIFNNCYNFVTPFSKEKWKKEISSKLKDFVYQRNFFSIQADSLIEEFEKVWNKYLKDESSLLISNEALTNPPFFNIPRWVGNYQDEKFPISKQLSMLVKYAKSKNIKIKVLLTLRNQPKWLASLYAQRSQKRLNADQQDFEKSIKELLDDKSLTGIGYLDWSKWIEELEEVLGSNNLCILLQEEMNSYKYWEKLVRFLNLRTEAKVLLEKSKETRSNTRSLDNEMSWKLKHRSIMSFYLYKKLIRIFSYSKHAEKILIIIALLIDKIFLKKNRINKLIILDKKLDMEIRKICSSYNARLYKKINRDISYLGY